MKLSDIDFQDQTHQMSYKLVMRMTVLANIQSQVQCLVGLSENAQLCYGKVWQKGSADFFFVFYLFFSLFYMHRCYTTRHYVTLHYNMLTKKTDQIFTWFLRAIVLLGGEKDSIYYNEAVICYFF